jgi:tetratricopeptide (TPR) repeat protein
MEGYGVRDVERLVRLSPATIRALVKAGLVAPARGPGQSLIFSFQDLTVFRTAQALLKARVPPRRLARAMKALRQVAESGQYALDFGNEGPAPKVVASAASPVVPPTARADKAEAWFENARALEDEDIAAAVRAYGRALAADPAHLDARINLGWLLHDVGMMKEAERIYRTAPRPVAEDPLLLYNLGVLMDDMRRPVEAIAAYEAAVRADPALADGHYNLALLFERLRRPREAIRHMSQYRRLVSSSRR